MSVHSRRFTLIEVVVAIALLVVVATIVATAGATFYSAYERSLRVTEHLKELMAIDNLMDTHIRNMIPFNWTDEEGKSRLLFSGEEDRIHFTTLRRSYGDRPGTLLFVKVFVEENKLVAEYSPYPRFPWSEEGDESFPFTREIIAENISHLTFEYAEKSTEVEGSVDFLETFLEEENSVLPLAIKMSVEWLDGKKEVWLRRVAGVSKESTFGKRDTSTTSSSSSSPSAASANSVNFNRSSGNNSKTNSPAAPSRRPRRRQ